MDTYDNCIYAIGKGPSATTVSIQTTVITYGESMLIQGTVTDISAGTKEQATRFPNGVPAVADASMSDWMLYVYKQFPRPTDVAGVEVTLSVLDANNNYREIGKTTSDSDGFYRLLWKPDIPGTYTVIASFAGSESYWPSHAETAFGVMEAPEPTAGPEPEPPSMTDTYVLGVGAAIIIAGGIFMYLFYMGTQGKPLIGKL